VVDEWCWLEDGRGDLTMSTWEELDSGELCRGACDSESGGRCCRWEARLGGPGLGGADPGINGVQAGVTW
jgi:hypothetical protein